MTLQLRAPEKGLVPFDFQDHKVVIQLLFLLLFCLVVIINPGACLA